MKKPIVLLFTVAIFLTGVGYWFLKPTTKSHQLVLANEDQLSSAAAASVQSQARENLLDWMKAGTYSYRFTRETQTATISGILAVSGEDFAIDLQLSSGGQIKIIYQNGVTTIFDPHRQVEMSLDINLPEEIMPLTVEFVQKMHLVGKGKQKIADKTYFYQDYQAQQQQVRFYLVDNQVVMIAPRFNQDVNWLISLQDVSKDLPNDAFIKPENNFTRI